MVARGVGEGDGYGGYRAQLVAELSARGSRTWPCCARCPWYPGTSSCPRASVTAPMRTRRCRSAAGGPISQPWVQARSLELARLTGRERVLEVGAGSGYQTALLAHCAEQVFSIERLVPLAQRAKAALAAAGVTNISVMVGDGTLGWRPFPYDAIIVSAGSPEVPQPLVEQLAPGGRLILPIGDRDAQALTLCTRAPTGTWLARR